MKKADIWQQLTHIIKSLIITAMNLPARRVPSSRQTGKEVFSEQTKFHLRSVRCSRYYRQGTDSGGKELGLLETRKCREPGREWGKVSSRGRQSLGCALS